MLVAFVTLSEIIISILELALTLKINDMTLYFDSYSKHVFYHDQSKRVYLGDTGGV